jgi:hypothetical protein
LPIAGGEDPMHAELYTQNYEQEQAAPQRTLWE